MGPLISAVMPVYNASNFLREAIESVLKQTYVNFELIIVNDGSGDNSQEIIDSYALQERRIITISDAVNKGTSHACNEGLKVAGGKYLAFTAADDVQFPERFEKTVSYLEQSPEIDMVFFNYELIDESGSKLGRSLDFPEFLNNQNVLLHQLRRNYMWSGLVTVKRTPDIVFDEELPCSVDYDLFIRLLIKNYRFGYIDEPLMFYRSHTTNISGNAVKSRKACQRILRKIDLDELEPRMVLHNNELDVMITFAMVKMMLDEWEQATNFLEQAMLSPGADRNYELFFYLGVVNYKLSNHIESIKNFTEALTILPNEATALNNLAVLKHLSGDETECVELLNKALLFRPQYMDAKNNLERISCGEKRLILTERILRGQLVHGENYKTKID